MDAIHAAKGEADEAYREKRFEAAVSAYGTALELSEQQHSPELLHLLYSNRSAAKLALKDFKGALADAQASVAVNDSWVKGWFRSAKALQGLGNLEFAVQAAEKAQQLEPSNKDVRTLLQQLKQQQAQAAPQQPHSDKQPQQQESPAQQQQQQQHAELPHQPGDVQQQQQQQQLPWKELNKLRSQLDVKRLPQQLVKGSRYVPSPDGINQNLLLLLHGLGDTPAGFTALAQRMALPQTACLALCGPLVVQETDGGRAWFTVFDDYGDFIKPCCGDKRRPESLAATLQLMQQLLFDTLPAVGGWRPSQIQLLGFSQGGCVAMELARVCTGDRQLGGVVAVSAGLLEETVAQLADSTSGGSNSSSSSTGPNSTSAAAAGTPVLITYGDKDDVVSRQRVDHSVAALQAAGCPVQLKVLPGKCHGMINSEAEMRVCMQFWAEHLMHRPADPDFVEVQS